MAPATGLKAFRTGSAFERRHSSRSPRIKALRAVARPTNESHKRLVDKRRHLAATHLPSLSLSFAPLSPRRSHLVPVSMTTPPSFARSPPALSLARCEASPRQRHEDDGPEQTFHRDALSRSPSGRCSGARIFQSLPVTCAW